MHISGVNTPYNMDCLVCVSLYNRSNHPSQVTMSTLLLVDDDDSLPLLLHLAIRRSGIHFDLHFVCDGEEAVQYLTGKGEYGDQARHPFPSLVLLDLKMPR